MPMPLRFLLSLLILIPGVLKGQTPGEISITGAKGVIIFLAVDSATGIGGYSESRIRNDVELRIRESGVPIFGTSAIADTGVLHLWVSVQSKPVGTLGEQHIYNIDVEIRQLSYVIRPDTIVRVYTQTWTSGSFGVVSALRFVQVLKSLLKYRWTESRV
jgi:hypothetical protein